MDAILEAGGQVLAMDVTREADLQGVVRRILAEQPRIDVLVNNAGVGLYGAAEDFPLEQARHEFEVNLFGPARLTQLVLPYMRKRGSGTIVNVSSVGGEIAIPLGAWYHASKHALEAYSDTLRQEVKRFGIDVVLIQPGIIKTEFQQQTPEALQAVSGQGAYRNMAKAMLRQFDAMFGEGGPASDPAVVAKAIRKAIEAASPRPRYAVGYLAGPILMLNRLLPDRLYDRIVTRRFG